VCAGLSGSGPDIKKSEREASCLLLFFHLLLLSLSLHSVLLTTSSGISEQPLWPSHRSRRSVALWKTSRGFSARLGLLRFPSLWTEQLPVLSFSSIQTATVELLLLYDASQSNTPLLRWTFTHSLSFSRELFCILSKCTFNQLSYVPSPGTNFL
jgi:hypothetical protein